TVAGNAASEENGGIGTNVLTLADSTVSDNTAKFSGGIGVNTATLTNSTVSGNFATIDGGGIAGLTLTLTDSTVSGNTAASGEGISGGNVTLTNSTVSGNTATTAAGGGIIAKTATLTNSTVSGNSAGGDGGGINAAEVTLTNSTVSGNAAGAQGGGIHAIVLALLNVTVTDNSAHEGGGVFHQGRGTASVRNSILAGNLVDFEGDGPDVSGAFTSGGHNLIGDGTGGTGFTNATTMGDQVGTAADPIDPQLGPLADNGGPPRTHAVLPGSPGLHRGHPRDLPAPDQRRRASRRLFGPADIGAFEAQPPADPPTTSPRPVVDIRVRRVRRRTRVDVVVDGALKRSFFPFGKFSGRVLVRQADVNRERLAAGSPRAPVAGSRRARTSH